MRKTLKVFCRRQVACTIWNSRTVGERSKLERCRIQEKVTRIDRLKPIGIRETTSVETPQEIITIDSKLFMIWPAGKRTNRDSKYQMSIRDVLRQRGAKEGLSIAEQDELHRLQENRCKSTGTDLPRSDTNAYGTFES